MQKTFFYSSAFILFIFFANTLSAQLTVDDTPTPEELAESLLGEGVTISDVTLDCTDGAFGLFECIDCNVGIGSGLVLTSGDVTVAEGPNTGTGDTGSWGAGGDEDLSEISGFETFDACVLEFDVTVASDSLIFNYVFGSEEYTTYVNSSVNDAFGLFISGPGITGLENLALIPTTTIGISINTVNPLEYEEYYIDNGVGCTPSGDFCSEGILSSPYTDEEYYIGYDGFTTVMTAKAYTIPCETYHLKLGIADAGDGVLDSGVFIEAGSLSSPGVVLSYITDLEFEGYTNIIEGCVDGSVTVDLSFSPTDTFSVYLGTGGTATSGVDYDAIPDSIVFYPGDTGAVIPLDVLADGLGEGVETIMITVELGCASGGEDTLIISIYEDIPLEITPDTAICYGDTLTLIADGAVSYSWSPVATLSDPDEPVTDAYPLSSTTYTVSAIVGSCTKSLDVNVDVLSPPEMNTSGDDEICIGESIEISASGAVTYLWTPAATLDIPDISHPTATPIVTTTYFVTGANEIGCTSTEELTITVHTLPNVTAEPNTLGCYGDEVQLMADGAVNYSWSPSDALNNNSIADPVATIYETVIYTVTGTDANGCENTATVTVEIDPVPYAQAFGDTVIYLGESAFLYGIGGGDFYWTPAESLNDPYALNPIATPGVTTTYILTVSSIAGCTTIDSVTVVVTDKPLVLVPNAFSPNGDGINDLINFIARGDIATLHFSIYNRWGEMLYETNTPVGGWDGKINGEEQPIGVYVYLVTLTDLVGRDYVYKGNFMLVK
ncbi:MAG: choice-of-anchor L domain-containing protein [Fimbriimonadaceae bacterium]|nr:choice-of-anchor L domain-containing protein [Chitinophagales bacterium]